MTQVRGAQLKLEARDPLTALGVRFSVLIGLFARLYWHLRRATASLSCRRCWSARTLTSGWSWRRWSLSRRYANWLSSLPHTTPGASLDDLALGIDWSHTAATIDVALEGLEARFDRHVALPWTVHPRWGFATPAADLTADAVRGVAFDAHVETGDLGWNGDHSLLGGGWG